MDAESAAGGKPRVQKDPRSPYWLVKLPGCSVVAYRSWRYAVTIALGWSDQDAAWRWYQEGVA